MGDKLSEVSIPNGDRHYLEHEGEQNDYRHICNVSIPNGDRHYLERQFFEDIVQDAASFNPQWG